MRRTITVAVFIGLLTAALTMPAEAGKKKAKPVATTLYMHGQQGIGEADGAQWFADGAGATSPLTMDTKAPEGSSAKSMAFGSPVWNSQCTGLPLGFPTFTGNLAGTIKGDAKVTAFFSGAPQAGVARIWADTGVFAFCNDQYVEPASEVEFEAPSSGSIEIVFPGLNLTATSSILVEFLVPDRAAPISRLQYDSSSAATKIEFNCIPASGTSCAP